MKTPAPSNPPPSPEERLEAMEYLLGQTLLALESDSAGIRAKLKRLEAALNAIAPGKVPPATDQDEGNNPFTMDSLGEWMQTCTERMRHHKAVTTRQLVAIGETTARVLELGASLTPEPAPAIGQAALAALAKAKHPRPPA